MRDNVHLENGFIPGQEWNYLREMRPLRQIRKEAEKCLLPVKKEKIKGFSPKNITGFMFPRRHLFTDGGAFL